MKYFKNIICMAVAALVAIAFTACSEKGGAETGADITIAVDVNNVTATSAKIEVSHDGKAANSWYGFVTTDVNTNELALIKAAVSDLKQGDLASQLKFSKNFVTILNALTPNTAYKYIAFGLTEDGVVYGNHGAVEFTTLEANTGGNTGGNPSEDEVYTGMNVNPSWSIAYTGVGTIEGTEYNNTVTVTSTDNNPYTIAIVYASEYDSSKLRGFGEKLIEDMYSYIDENNYAYGTSYVLNDLLYRGNGKTAFENLYPGYYVAVALGITSKGEVSGLYAVSATFEIKEEEPTSLYTSWMGNWVLNGDNNVSNNITLSRDVANKSIAMTGLMNLPFTILGDYSTERNDIIFYAQTIVSDYEISDGEGGTAVANIQLVGLTEDGKFYGLDKGSYAIAIAGVLEGGQRAIVRYGVNLPDYPEFVAMMIVAEVNGTCYSLDSKEGTTIPAFNIMATIDAPAAEATTLAAHRFSTPYRNGHKRLMPTLRLGRNISEQLR